MNTTLMMTRLNYFLALLVLTVLLHAPVQSIFQDEAGKSDFLVATTGHGPVHQIEVVTDDTDTVGIITSDSRSGYLGNEISGSSCYIASRSMNFGMLNWRRNVCSSGSSQQKKHAMTSLGKQLFTIDNLGMLRSWDASSGDLLWESQANSEPSLVLGTPMVWTSTLNDDESVVAADSSSVLSVHNAATGEVLNNEELKKEAQSQQPKQSDDNQNFETSCQAAGLPSIRLDISSKRELHVETADGSDPVLLDVGLSLDDQVSTMKLLVCRNDAAVLIVATDRGETKQVTVTRTDSDKRLVQVYVDWSAEEGLGRIDTALLLDGAVSSLAADLVRDDVKEVSHDLLHFSTRLESQWRNLFSLNKFTLNNAAPDRSHTFGFVKIAVMLSLSSNRIYGMETTGLARGQLRYYLDLPRNAKWHKLIHGTPNAAKVVHGSHGGVVHYGRDVLALSEATTHDTSSNSLFWTCFDAATSTIHDQGSIALTSPVSQVVPIHVSGLAVNRCRQSALLLLGDGSVVLVPNDADTMSSVHEEIRKAPNGFYAHKINEAQASLESYLIYSNTSTATIDERKEHIVKSRLSGALTFMNERIIKVGYPIRDEVMESPCSVVGDDSLLLKYMNPHLAVIITMTQENSVGQDERIVSALQKSIGPQQQSQKQKRKPIGVTSGPESSTLTSTTTVVEKCNFFVNVVDTVAGRILYRIGHSNVVGNPIPSVVISENWIFYTFMNEKTRRAEVGVLSLYEGMIDSKGLTAFSSPERSEYFSSLDVRESPKPVVLSKTFSLAKPVTAIGVTTSRNGISNRRLVLAGLDGLVYAVDRKLLEPRRPVGPVKEHEKKEGLLQYVELIPTVSYMSLSYHQSIELVKGIVTAPTELESQTLILAFGGPDLFFARTSPSRGFDLLPDSFNRPLLSIIVIGMLVGTVVLKRVVAKKTRTEGWL